MGSGAGWKSGNVLVGSGVGGGFSDIWRFLCPPRGCYPDVTRSNPQHGARSAVHFVLHLAARGVSEREFCEAEEPCRAMSAD